MSEGAHGDEYGTIVDRLHELGRRRASELPGFDVDKTINRAYAARDAGAINFWNVLSPAERLDEDGLERLIAERGPGDLVGEGGTMPGNVRSASVIALDAVQALVMKTADYTAFVAEYPGIPDLVKKQTYDRATGRADRL
jgi:hypothetical protein